MTNKRILLLCCLLPVLYAGHAMWENRYEKWAFPWGDHEIPPTVCQDGTVLKVAGSSLLARDGATGQLKWTFNYPASGHEFSPSSPIVGGNNTVFIGYR